jgi:SAM-dependent methyltransferase
VSPADRRHDLQAELELQQRAWEHNVVLRSLYRSWFLEIAGLLSPIPGPTIELGSGIGKFREAQPDVVLTDVERTPWAEQVVDAEKLPFADASVANLALIDVLHHIPHPVSFFDEAQRCLAPGGRVVAVEPYCSPVSYVVYRRWHHETTDLDVDPFAESARSSAGPLDSNQALPTLIFFRHPDHFRERWPELDIVILKRFALFAYPLSGGWRRRPLLPRHLLRPTLVVESALAPLARLLAHRCLVVLERKAAPDQ